MTENKFNGVLLTAEYKRDGTVLPGNGSPSVCLLPDEAVFKDYLENASDLTFHYDFYGVLHAHNALLRLTADDLLHRVGFAYVPLGYATTLGHKFFPQKGNELEGVEYFRGLGGIPIDVLKPAITFRDGYHSKKEPKTIDVLIGHDLRSLVKGEVKKGHSLVVISCHNSFSPIEEHQEAREKVDRLVSLYARELISHQSFVRRTITESVREYFHPIRKNNQDHLNSFIQGCDCYYSKEALFQAIYGRK